ncbi:1-deoxy-D-xylulose-5-phosphate reductoisomerase [Abyssibius alkaniclasticus]|uniref:1-deoxy-D-xylulose-5-phosphate reductoisomerase n=1 Tax=Abyssibius alkaniclasticus TaxID=2881234 RepID=UPI00405A0145
MRRISIFGATGSVGVNTVDLINRGGGRAAFDVVALSGGANIALLAEQARNLGARIAVTAYPQHLNELRRALEGSGVEAAAGPDALAEAASRPTDWAMSAIVGVAGLRPTLELAASTRVLALANKESLVCAGALLRARCAAHKTRLLPVDSEHSALWQAMNGEDAAKVRRLILTATGGPFRTWSLAQMANATPAQAVAHPTWDMGQRISVDSASMFNKALEVIEAANLYDMPAEAIEVIVHPQAIVHSMVEFCDGAILAHMGTPDMRAPIGYALNWPDRAPLPVPPLNLETLRQLDFEPPDPLRFPALRLARQVLAAGGGHGAAFNAAKEAALDAFLAGQIGFLDMARLVEDVLDQPYVRAVITQIPRDLNTVLTIDTVARNAAKDWIAKNKGLVSD